MSEPSPITNKHSYPKNDELYDNDDYYEHFQTPKKFIFPTGVSPTNPIRGLGNNRNFEINPSKIVNDVVHGHMEVPDYILEFVDTEQFQRLRDLKQLGTTNFVFPCANHTRFEHSLGVSHLAGKYIEKIRDTQRELDITEDECKFVRIAGLCHDLGHGPFSHAFESWIERTGKKFHHEQMSIEMLEWLIDDHGLEYSTDDIKYISNLITGKHRPVDRKFIYDIVANHRNSVDVDKFDYLARDSYYLGRANVFDSARLMEFSRVIDDEICYSSKEIYNLYEMFHTRYSLHKIVYTHKVGKAIEYMISDAFDLADPYLQISEQISNPRDYINLTDSLLKRIEQSKEPQLKESRDIIRNIRNRNLYKFVDEVLVSSQHNIPSDLSKVIASEGNDLVPEDIIVHRLQLNYAFKDKDPVQHTHFFNRGDNTKKFHITKEQTSQLIPSQFQEERIRIFCRKKEKYENVQNAFRKILSTYNIIPNPSFTASPFKSQNNNNNKE